MPLYIIFADRPEFRNSSQINSVICAADSEAAARRLAEASPVNGESKCHPEWRCERIANDSVLTTNPLWIEGDCVSFIGRTRGQ